MPEEIATAEDIHAARPDVPIGTIRNQMRQGAPWFPGSRLIGRTRVVPVSEAEEYVAKYQRYARQDQGAGDPLMPPAPTTPEEKE